MEEIRYIFLGEEKGKENKIMLTAPKYLKGHYIKRSTTYLEGHPEPNGKVSNSRI